MATDLVTYYGQTPIIDQLVDNYGAHLEKLNRRSQSQIDSNCDIYEMEKAIQLLDILRPCVAERKFNDVYVNALNQYLKIVPTPLGMQIDPYRIYRTVVDVDYQRELLNSLLAAPAPQVTAVAVGHAPEAAEPKVVSLKTISKNFWRHL